MTSPETVATDTLITQLRTLDQLTRSEAQIARIRLAQARTDAVRRELRENGDNAVRRAQRITAQLRALDALPDVVSPAAGRVLALVKSTVEQVQPVDEALLGDLALEHQLLDRARYVRVLAERAGLSEVQDLADDLVTAHSATVEWLTTVLAEEALGGPAALMPTPLQRVAGGVVQAVTFPTRFAVRGAKRAVNNVYRTGEQTRETLQGVAGTVAKLGSDGREVATTGRDAALRRAERIADRDGASGVAQA
ncbi:MAG TPA: ferritin-like domain-containing protein, partial [Pseudonocardia sp.]